VRSRTTRWVSSSRRNPPRSSSRPSPPLHRRAAATIPRRVSS
jgi:hypothetical protein